jgi:uncharacterized protein YqhQ
MSNNALGTYNKTPNLTFENNQKYMEITFDNNQNMLLLYLILTIFHINV